MMPVVLFSGFNQRAIVAFCRSLARNRHPFGLVALPQADPIFKTRWRDRLCAQRRHYALVWDDLLACLEQTRDRLGADSLLIAPSAESLNLLFLRHRDELEARGMFLPLPEESLYLRLSEKRRFVEECLRFHLPVPRILPMPSPGAPLAVPAAAKPIADISPDGRRVYPRLLLSQDDTEAFLREENTADYFLQEYVSGSSLYLLYHISRSGLVSALSQHNLVQQPDGKSMVMAVNADAHTRPMAGRYENMLCTLGFHGLIMIELRGVFPGGGEDWLMIEANPRMWGPSQLFLDAGTDLFAALLNDWCGTRYPVHSPSSSSVYYWSGGALETMGQGGDLSLLADRAVIARHSSRLAARDIYNRPDTRELYDDELREALARLYADGSKHAVYQNVPAFVAEATGFRPTIQEHWRGDAARWEWLCSHVDFAGKTIVDVGANTGFFTLSIARAWPSARCIAIEGNRGHRNFIRLLAERFSLHNVTAQNAYVTADDADSLAGDIVLLFNVLHHAGVDFDRGKIADEHALFAYCVKFFAAMKAAKSMLFQMGYHWGGDRQKPAVALQDDAGKCLYTAKALLQAGWRIDRVASAEACASCPGGVRYTLLQHTTVAALNADPEQAAAQVLADLPPSLSSLSEFYRRPIFLASR